jgi:hypothetical protein
LAADFDAELGRTLAYEDAIRQLWPLIGFALKSTPGLRERYGIDQWLTIGDEGFVLGAPTPL